MYNRLLLLGRKPVLQIKPVGAIKYFRRRKYLPFGICFNADLVMEVVLRRQVPVQPDQV